MNLQKVHHNLTKSMSRKQIYLTALLLGFAAIVLYLPMIGWGVPYTTAPNRTKTFTTDEILPLETLAEMHNTFVAIHRTANLGFFVIVST